MVFSQLRQSFFKCPVNILLEIFIYGTEIPCYLRQNFIQQNELVFIELIDQHRGLLTTFNEMGNDHIKIIICTGVIQQFSEKRKVIVVDIKIHGYF